MELDGDISKNTKNEGALFDEELDAGLKEFSNEIEKALLDTGDCTFDMMIANEDDVDSSGTIDKGTKEVGNEGEPGDDVIKNDAVAVKGEEACEKTTEDPAASGDEQGEQQQREEERLLNFKIYLDESKEHPYLSVINDFTAPEELTILTENKPPKSFLEASFEVVQTEESLKKLVDVLKTKKEIGLDIVCDSHESYKRHVCVITISTADSDYIVDAVALREHLALLGEIFLDPNIVKVFFVVDKKMMWLQYDLNFYFVNIFVVKDGLWALGNKSALYHFLKTNYGATKPSYGLQGSNFRSRPLTVLQKEFCRFTTRYLIHAYHDVKNKLVSLPDSNTYSNLLIKWNNFCKLMFVDPAEAEVKKIVDFLDKRYQCQLDLVKELYQYRIDTAKRYKTNPIRLLGKVTLSNLVHNLPVTFSVIRQMCGSKELQKSDVEAILSMIISAKRKHSLLMDEQFYKAIRETVIAEAQQAQPLPQKRKADGGGNSGAKKIKGPGPSPAPNNQANVKTSPQKNYNPNFNPNAAAAAAKKKKNPNYNRNMPQRDWRAFQREIVPPFSAAPQPSAGSVQVSLTPDQVNLLQALCSINSASSNQGMSFQNRSFAPSQLALLQGLAAQSSNIQNPMGVPAPVQAPVGVPAPIGIQNPIGFQNQAANQVLGNLGIQGALGANQSAFAANQSIFAPGPGSGQSNDRFLSEPTNQGQYQDRGQNQFRDDGNRREYRQDGGQNQYRSGGNQGQNRNGRSEFNSNRQFRQTDEPMFRRRDDRSPPRGATYRDDSPDVGYRRSSPDFDDGGFRSDLEEEYAGNSRNDRGGGRDRDFNNFGDPSVDVSFGYRREPIVVSNPGVARRPAVFEPPKPSVYSKGPEAFSSPKRSSFGPPGSGFTSGRGLPQGQFRGGHGNASLARSRFGHMRDSY